MVGASFKTNVLSFCAKYGVKTPDFGELYVDFINSRADDESTVQHHSRCDIFMVVVDQQAQDSTNKQYIFLLCALPWTSRTHSGHLTLIIYVLSLLNYIPLISKNEKGKF
jgi:hypothetical protein